MTDKQRDAIRRHGEQLLAIFPDATERDPVKLCKRLRRLEATAHRCAEKLCSEEMPESWRGTLRDWDLQADSALSATRELLGSDRPWLNGDPRGYALKVDLRQCHCVAMKTGRSGTQTSTGRFIDCGPCPDCGGSGRERLHTDMGGYGIIAPEIGPDGF